MISLNNIGRGASGLFRLGIVAMVSLVLIPPVAAGVTVITLLNAPLPGAGIPDEKPQRLAEPSIVLDSEGKQIGLFRGFDQTVPIEMADVPQVMKDAMVSIEDRRFWEHNGVDIEGIGRAAQANAEAGGVKQGGSTITQQYVKNVYLTDERTVERKVREALLATEVEEELSKEEILFGYLESSYFGAGAYGIGAAAKVYFDVPVSDLDLSQAALLAGLVKAPSRLSPRTDVEAANDRRLLVLESMREEGYITDAEFEEHAARPIWLGKPEEAPDPDSIIVVPPKPKGASAHPFFVDWVEKHMIEMFGEEQIYNGGFTIETTIRPDLQANAEASVATRLENTEAPVDMSLVSIEPNTGHVVAMVGGRDYKNSQVNLATGGSLGMQPGSSFKPIVLARALTLGIAPETVYEAPARWKVPGCTGDKCYLGNYAGGGGGSMTLRDATRVSMNTVFTQLLVDVGIPETVEFATQLGFNRLDPERGYGPSLALGAAETSPMEMASAYGTFANRGQRIEPTGISRVIDRDGNVILDNGARQGDQVVDPVVADTMSDVLRGVVEGGTGKAAAIGRPVAGKTGTAQEYRAAWFVGYTPQLSTAVWMGHADTPTPLKGVNGVGAVTGGSHPARAFADFMNPSLEGVEVQEFVAPEEIVPTEAPTSEEVVRILRKKERELAGKKRPSVLPSDCNGAPCTQNKAPSPKVPKAEQPKIPTTTRAPEQKPTTTRSPTSKPTTQSPSSGSREQSTTRSSSTEDDP